jgi:hypothetical protein
MWSSPTKEGSTMSRGSLIPTTLIALGFVASVATAAHAGGGGAGIGDTFMLNCYHIEGSNPPHVLTVEDQFFPDGREGAVVGKAKLLCTPAAGIVTSEHSINAGLADADHVKCYEATAANDSPKVNVQVFDPFGLETVKVSAQKFICVGAIKCPVGEQCPAQ